MKALHTLILIASGMLPLAGFIGGNESPGRPRAIAADYLIENISIVDVEKGAIQSGRYVAIAGNRIVGIYDHNVSLRDGGQTIDGSRKYLIPGLWDMHFHYSLNHQASNPLLIANGVTGIREMWGIPGTIEEIRANVASGSLIAPDIHASGNIVDGNPPSWPWASSVKDAEEARLEVAEQARLGVDFIKIYSRLSGSTPISRTLQLSPIMGQEECHATAKEVQRRVQA